VSKILVIGDVIEDVIVIPESKIRPNTDTKSAIHKSMGGQAANVASWAGHLGVDTTFVACVQAADIAKLTKELERYGVSSMLQSSEKQTGSLVVLVQDQQRAMLTDRGANLDLDLYSIDTSGYAIVYLSGYSLLGKSFDNLQKFAANVKSNGALLAIDPGSYGFINDHGAEEFKKLLALADLVFPNLEEEQLLKLSGIVPLTVITDGDKGARAVFESGDQLEVAGIAVASIDPTGAGDAFCAGFLADLVNSPALSGLDPDLVQKALESGVSVGALAVQLVGARPSFNSGV
jgi:sugar/nucleoside kinase (ribokinase family)